jgi:hypothetical protein
MRQSARRTTRKGLEDSANRRLARGLRLKFVTPFLELFDD